MGSAPEWRPVPASRFSSAAGPRAASASRPEGRCRSNSVQRRNRLSRSRDFDAVYRHGRSVSTRFLTLYWFQREESVGDPRLGFAVPKAVGNAVVRNRIKRQLRDIVRAKLEGRPPTNDYVLVVRQGLPEAVEANGHDWLEARVDEVLGKATA
jgi:ribonuclease P protein component